MDWVGLQGYVNHSSLYLIYLGPVSSSDVAKRHLYFNGIRKLI